MNAAKVTRRKIRRAIGPQAEAALLDREARTLELERFLLLRHSCWRRWWWVLTGRF